MRTCLIALLTVISMTGASLHGAVLNFRSGTITAAEITATPVKISNLDPDAFPALPDKRLFAVLSVKLHPGRKITIFDYSLESNGATYPCVAVNTGRTFDSSEKTFSAAAVQLLFIIEAGNMPPRGNMNIKCNLQPTDGTYDITVPFKNIGSKAPVRLKQIPENGLLEKN